MATYLIIRRVENGWTVNANDPESRNSNTEKMWVAQTPEAILTHVTTWANASVKSAPAR